MLGHGLVLWFVLLYWKNTCTIPLKVIDVSRIEFASSPLQQERTLGPFGPGKKLIILPLIDLRLVLGIYTLKK